MSKKLPKKQLKNRDIHIFISSAEYAELKAIAIKEMRSVSAQVRLYIDRGRAQDAKR